MKFIRGETDYAVDLIEPFLLSDNSGLMDKSEYASALREMIRNERENTYVLIAFDDETDEVSVLGFLVAYAPPNKHHVFLSQAWCNPKGTEKQVTDLAFLRLINWAQNLGRARILMETTREGAMQRKWGFQPVSTTMEFRLDSDFEQRLLAKLQGDTNGQQWSENNERSDRVSETDRQADLRVPERTDRTGSDSLYGESTGATRSESSQGSSDDEGVQPSAVPEAAESGGDVGVVG